MATETVVLDPSELASTRTSLDITPWIDFDGVDWGDAQITAVMADQLVGATPVDFTIPARQFTIPLNLKTVGGTSFATIRSTLQAKIGLLQAQGGYLKRILASGGTVFADITNASLHLSGDWYQANRDADINASITLEAQPDFYGAEETLSDHTETTLPEITFTETTVNGGDFPLGDRVRVVVDDDQAQNQRGLFWHFRGRNYSSASTAASAYEAEALQTLDTATKVAKVGASGGTVVTHGTLSTNWTPVVGTNIGGSTYLTHQGSYRVWARVFTTSGTAVQARFVYDVGDLVYPAENDAVRCYDGGTFHILNLGEMRLDPTPTGTHRWQGQVQAKGDAGAESFSVDRLWFQNLDESAGILRAPFTVTQGLASYSARSEFNTESGAMTGDSLAVGGAWTALTGSDTDDWSISTATARRTTTADTGTGLGAGRGVSAGTGTYTTIAAQVSGKASAWGASQGFGVFVRGTDASTGLFAILTSTGLIVYKNTTAIGQYTFTPGAATYYAIGLASDAGGRWVAYLDGRIVLSAADSALATGGALASGKVGIYDYSTDIVSVTRNLDSFAAWVPSDDAVIFASRSAELGTQGVIRQDTGGTAYGPVTSIYGDLPRMPNRSSAGTVEFMAKASRGELQTVSDGGIDDISARVYRRASYLVVN